MLSTLSEIHSGPNFYRNQIQSFIAEGEEILQEARAQLACIPTYPRRRSPAGEAVICAMNLVQINTASTERLLQELRAVSSFKSAEKLLVELREHRARMPRYVERALEVGETLLAEVAAEPVKLVVVPEPKPKASSIAEELKNVKTLDDLVKFMGPEGPSTVGSVCALPGCGLVPRENSIYCCDGHRVNMARLKAKAREAEAKAKKKR